MLSKKLFEFLLHVCGLRFPLKARRDRPIASHEKSDRKAEHTAVALPDGGIPHDHGEIQGKTAHQSAHRLCVVVHGDGDDLQALLFVFALPCGESREFQSARSAPGGPEIQQDDLSTAGAEVDGIAAEVAAHECRCTLVYE